MRFWTSRRSSSPPLLTDNPLIAADLLRRSVEDVLAIRDRSVHGSVIVFRGQLTTPAPRALDTLVESFGRLGYTPAMRGDASDVVVQAWPRAAVIERQRPAINVVLFVLTCLTTLVTGSGAFATFDPFAEPARLLEGVPFAFTLLGILGIHEFGHYFTARWYKASVSLPYFIPAPPLITFGTLGAVIRMRSPARDRNSLFDIAAAGPLAGLVIAVPAILLGLEWSTIGPVPAGGLVFGDSLLMRFLVYLKFGRLPEGWDVFVHPVALAGWVGLLVTALNLFPVGQLDGGRIAYAIFGRRHRLVGIAAFVGLIVLGAVTWSPNWFVWAAVLYFLIGFHHSPPLDDLTPLSAGRRAVGIACLILLVLLIPPVPIQLG